MDLPKALGIVKGFPGKIKLFPGKVKWFFSAFFSMLKEFKLPKLKFQKPDISKIREMIEGLINRARDLANDLLDRIPEEKKRPFLIGLGVLGSFLLILLVVLLLKPGRRGQNSASVMAKGLAIPQEELFLPAEPDFIPEFLLEREPRKVWQLEDIRPYWKPPEISGFWREEIKSAVDKIMEGVP
jgi:hypothetical protein